MKKTVRYVLSILMAVSLMAGLTVSAGATEEVTVPPVLEGEGTKESPFLIGTAEELEAYFRCEFDLNGLGTSEENAVVTYAMLTSDLEFEGTINNNCTSLFYGVLDGDGHTISGLEILNGQFISSNYGTLKNLIFEECTFRNTRDITGVCYTNYGVIENCLIAPSVLLEEYIYEESENFPIGGNPIPPAHAVIAYENAGIIRSCVSFASSDLNVSGICHHNSGEIIECVTSREFLVPDTIVGYDGEYFDVPGNDGTIGNCLALSTCTYSEMEEAVSEEELFSVELVRELREKTGIDWAVTDCGVVPFSVLDLVWDYTYWDLMGIPVVEEPAALFDIDTSKITNVTVRNGTNGGTYDITGTDWAEEILSVVNDFRYTDISYKMFGGWHYRIELTGEDEEYGFSFNRGDVGHVVYGDAVYYSPNSPVLDQLAGILDEVYLQMETPAPPEFSDVGDMDWHHDYIYFMVEQGLFSGTSAVTFEPDRSITRGEVVTVISRLYEQMTGKWAMASEDYTFTDVNPDLYYAEPISWAAKKGLVNGYPDGTFRPDEPIDRESFAAIMDRYLKLVGVEFVEAVDLLCGRNGNRDLVEEVDYADRAEISDWAWKSVEYLSSYRVLNGVSHYNKDDPSWLSTMYFEPQRAITRAETAAVISRILQAVTFAEDTETQRDVISFGFMGYEKELFLDECGWEIITDYESYQNLLNEVDMFFESREAVWKYAPLEAPLSEAYFETGAILALEQQRVGCPIFLMRLCECTIEGGTARLTMFSDSHGSTADVSGHIYLIQIPQGVTDVETDWNGYVHELEFYPGM